MVLGHILGCMSRFPIKITGFNKKKNQKSPELLAPSHTFRLDTWRQDFRRLLNRPRQLLEKDFRISKCRRGCNYGVIVVLYSTSISPLLLSSVLTIFRTTTLFSCGLSL